VSGELFEALTRAVTIARASGGAFDPTVAPLVSMWRQSRTTGRLPEAAALAAARSRVGWRQIELDGERRAARIPDGVRLDLGGIAKGYILQDALRALASLGVRRALVEAGGDVVVGEAPPGRAGWRIDVPGADAAFAGHASRLTNAALATSGPTAQFVEIDGTRYSHVIDPRTGLGVTAPFVAHVIGDDAATADALATALAVLGPDGLPTLRARFPGMVLAVRGDGSGSW
jgi:thiamine biosynthesis lipoprotein